MDNLFTLFDPDEYYSREVEPLGEMATIFENVKPSILITVNPDPNRIGNPYFKVFNMGRLIPNETKVARLHFIDSAMEYHQDHYNDWILSSKDIKNIKTILMKPHDDFPDYTVWDITKCMWNLEYHSFFSRSQRINYLNGELDDKYKDHQSYVPSTTEIPETWEYRPPKGKNKRK